MNSNVIMFIIIIIIVVYSLGQTMAALHCIDCDIVSWLGVSGIHLIGYPCLVLWLYWCGTYSVTARHPHFMVRHLCPSGVSGGVFRIQEGPN